MVHPFSSSVRHAPRGSVREVVEVGGALVRGGSDPGLLRAGEGGAGRPVRRSACSLPASLAGECRGASAREGRDGRPLSGAAPRRVLRVTRDYLDPRRARVRHTLLGRGRGSGAGRGGGAGLSASMTTAAFTTSPQRPSPAPPSQAPPPATHASSTHAVATHNSNTHAAVAPAAASSSGPEPRPRRPRRGVTGLASVVPRAARRRPERDAKSRKYVAGSARGRSLRGPPPWRPAAPPPDPLKPRGASCCCCPAAITTTPCSALALLPLHLLLLLTLTACLLTGAFVFHALEGPGGGGEGAVEVSHSAIVLPGTPRDPLMTSAREEVVDRLLNTSLTLVLHRSLDVIISTVIITPKMQAALRAFEQAGGGPLPTEKDVERFSRALMTEWRHDLYDLTARYHALVVRHAHGFQVGPAERQAIWDSEEPPPPLPWTLPTALVYCFCLVTTTGGLHAATEAGRAAGVVYGLVGVAVYVGVVVVWAARLGATLSLLLGMCARRKMKSPGRKGSKGGTSPYHKMHSNPTPPSPPLPKDAAPQHTPGRFTLLLLLLFLYIVGVGSQVLGGDTFWAGLENAIFALLTVRPPRPLPQSVPRVTGYLLFTLCGHLLLALLLYSLKVTVNETSRPRGCCAMRDWRKKEVDGAFVAHSTLRRVQWRSKERPQNMCGFHATM